MQCAKENTPRLREPKMASIIDVLKEMAGFNSELIEEIDDDGMMFVLGNKKNINGASVLLDTEFMEHVGSEIGNCYILPSSLHEVIAVPADKVEDVSYLKKMVKDVNETSVSEEDYLSDAVLFFDGWNVTVAE